MTKKLELGTVLEFAPHLAIDFSQFLSKRKVENEQEKERKLVGTRSSDDSNEKHATTASELCKLTTTRDFLTPRVTRYRFLYRWCTTTGRP